MSATRSTGLLFMAAIIVAAAQNHIKDGGTLRGFFALSVEAHRPAAGGGAGAHRHLACFAMYLWFHSGDALAFQHIQRAWGRAFANPFWNLWLTIKLQFENGNFRTISTDLAFGLAAIFGMVMSVIMAWKGRWDWAIFSLFGVLLPLSTNAYSMLRFVVGIAPILIMSAFIFSRWKWLFYLLLPVFLILDVLRCCRSGSRAPTI